MPRESLSTISTRSLQHRDLYEDSIHFNPAGASLQGDQAAATIRHALRM
jgi:hypothetical protein